MHYCSCQIGWCFIHTAFEPCLSWAMFRKTYYPSEGWHTISSFTEAESWHANPHCMSRPACRCGENLQPSKLAPPTRTTCHLFISTHRFDLLVFEALKAWGSLDLRTRWAPGPNMQQDCTTLLRLFTPAARVSKQEDKSDLNIRNSTGGCHETK